MRWRGPATPARDRLMERPYRHIDVERVGDVYCARLKQPKLNELQLDELADELNHLTAQDGCSKFVLSLGPEEPQFLYSVFLAQLVSLQRRLQARGGRLKLADVSPATLSIFDACHLTPLFDFAPNRQAAIDGFSG